VKSLEAVTNDVIPALKACHWLGVEVLPTM
jgi:hypothetical protein